MKIISQELLTYTCSLIESVIKFTISHTHCTFTTCNVRVFAIIFLCLSVLVYSLQKHKCVTLF